MLTPNEIQEYFERITNATPQSLPEEVQRRLILKGIIVELEEIAALSEYSLAASRVLYNTAASHPDKLIRNQAFLALSRLAQEGLLDAVDQIYRLAVEDDFLAGRQMIVARKWEPSRIELRVLFDWFSCLASRAAFPVQHLSAITDAYFHVASPGLQKRLLTSAKAVQMSNWAAIVSALQDGSESEMLQIVGMYTSLSSDERQLTIEQLKLQAQRGSKPAQEVLCRLFIHFNDNEAKKIIIENKYLPENIEQQALQFFLAEDWTAYSNLDFNHNLLSNVFETSDRSMRRRLMDHSRRTGQTEWLRGLGSAGEVRWPNDLADADWELAIDRLSKAGKPEDLWRLSQAAPPFWSANILGVLAKMGWMPESEMEIIGYTNLIGLAVDCLQSPLVFQPKKYFHTDASDIICLAFHPAGRMLAAGSSDQQIRIWDLPDGNPSSKPLISPIPVTRALEFNPDGEMLAVASGDHRIRVFHCSTGQMAKVLEGHQAMIRSLTFHPNGRVLFSAGFDGKVRFWRFPFGPELKEISPEEGEIFSIALGNEGKTLATGGTSGFVRLWAVPDGSLVREIKAHSGTITHLAASTSGELVASYGNDGAIHLWNSSNGNLISSIDSSSSGPVTSLCLLQNEMVLISGHKNGQIILWNTSSRRAISQLNKHQEAISGLVTQIDGGTLYSSDLSGKMFSWDLSTFLLTRMASRGSGLDSIAEMQNYLNRKNLSTLEKKWLSFSIELSRWNQRYEIELDDYEPVHIGEFDIELY